MWSVEPAHPRHVNRIANRMRECDVREVKAFGHTPREALRLAIKSSALAWTAVRNGEPEAMFGLRVASVIGGVGQPWMLGSDAIYDGRRELLKMAPRFLSAIEAETPILVNHVSTDNGRAIRFLRWLGFTVSQDVVEVGGVGFHRFSKGE